MKFNHIVALKGILVIFKSMTNILFSNMSHLPSFLSIDEYLGYLYVYTTKNSVSVNASIRKSEIRFQRIKSETVWCFIFHFYINPHHFYSNLFPNNYEQGLQFFHLHIKFCYPVFCFLIFILISKNILKLIRIILCFKLSFNYCLFFSFSKDEFLNKISLTATG